MLKAQGTQVFGVYPGPIDTRMTEAVPFQKASPADAARAIVAAIEAGIEDIFPDPMSEAMGAAYFADPKAVERQTSSMAV
jgi:NAD(P)-dependent dehydrogenase (short-subunit alcohol dehydrogenase family)